MARASMWRIYDKSVGMVAMEAPTESGIQEAYEKAPESIRGDLVILKPHEPVPSLAARERTP